jgi:thioredoxin reductase
MHATPTRDEVPLPDEVDVLVVGGGPAGLAAATWLGRYRRRTLVVDAGGPRNRWVEQVHGYLGSDPIEPRRLRDQARRDLAAYPHVTVLHGRVAGVAAAPGDAGRPGFRATLEDGRGVAARRVLLATGVRDRFPDLDGFFDHYGADVQHCPSCEGFDARGATVVVLGWGAHVPAFAALLLDWAERVTIVTDLATADITAHQRAELARYRVEVVDGVPTALLGERGALAGVRLADGRVVAATKAFFSIGHEPVTDLAEQLGCAVDDDGELVVDEHGETSVPGVYAAGDVTPGMQLVAVAVGKGTVAGIACALSLHGERTAPDAPPPAPATETLAPDDEPTGSQADGPPA